MPLIAAGMRAQILATYNQNLKNTTAIAQQIATAYGVYVAPALGPLGDPLIPKDPAMTPLKNTLLAIMNGQTPLASASQQIGTALIQIWLSPPMMTGLGGKCTLILTAPAVAKLSAIQANSYSEAAQTLSDALDLATKTVIITYPPPLSTAGPLT